MSNVNKEILMMVESIAREKDLNPEAVFDALEEALAFVARKKIGGDPKVTVEIDRKTGEQIALRHWKVIEQYEDGMNEDQQIMRVDLEAQHEGQHEFTESFEVEFGRSSAQLAKQAIYQRLRDVEQRSALEDIEDRGEGLLYGTVKSFQKGNVILDIGRLEAVLPKSECLPKDNLKVGSRIRVAIKSVDRVNSRDVVTVSRATPEFMRLLITQEVMQVEEGDIEIVKLVRTPGVRCKMIVRSHIKVDSNSNRLKNEPHRIIIGSNGIHAKAIAEETGGEHLDIILESDETADMVIQALLPASPIRLLIDEDRRVIEAAIQDESLGLVIGHKGNNVRLISELLGWTLDVMSEAKWQEKDQARMQVSLGIFMEALDLSQDLAVELVENGFSMIEDVAFCEIEEILAIDGMDSETAEEIQSRAKNAFNDRLTPARDSLSKVKGITEEELAKLVSVNVLKADDLADLDAYELKDLVPQWSHERAQELIMSARELWD